MHNISETSSGSEYFWQNQCWFKSAQAWWKSWRNSSQSLTKRLQYLANISISRQMKNWICRSKVIEVLEACNEFFFQYLQSIPPKNLVTINGQQCLLKSLDIFKNLLIVPNCSSKDTINLLTLSKAQRIYLLNEFLAPMNNAKHLCSNNIPKWFLACLNVFKIKCPICKSKQVHCWMKSSAGCRTKTVSILDRQILGLGLGEIISKILLSFYHSKCPKRKTLVKKWDIWFLLAEEVS